MARLHSKKHGKSGKVHQKDKTAPEWVEMSKEEVENLIIELAKKGVPPSKIGMELRDKHGIPNVKAITGKRIATILKENGVAPKVPEDLTNLINRAVRMIEHMKKNKGDVSNKVKLTHVESKIRRIANYYKQKGILPKDWKYSRENAALLIR